MIDCFLLTLAHLSVQPTRIPSSLCLWILDFLMNRLDHLISSTGTGVPQGCVLGLYFLFTDCDCVSTYRFNADNTTIVGFITTTIQWYLVRRSRTRYRGNDLKLNPDKTQEIIIDVRKNKIEPHTQLFIDGQAAERRFSFVQVVWHWMSRTTFPKPNKLDWPFLLNA